MHKQTNKPNVPVLDAAVQGVHRLKSTLLAAIMCSLLNPGTVGMGRAPAEEHAASGEGVWLGGHAEQHERAVDVQQGQQLRELVLGRHRVYDAVQRPHRRLPRPVARLLGNGHCNHTCG